MRTELRQMISLGNRIKQARENVGLTQDQLAEKVGISRTAIARYESGDIEPRIRNLVAIAECLNISTDYLLDVRISRAVTLHLSKKGTEALDVLLEELAEFKQDRENERKGS